MCRCLGALECQQASEAIASGYKWLASARLKKEAALNLSVQPSEGSAPLTFLFFQALCLNVRTSTFCQRNSVFHSTTTKKSFWQRSRTQPSVLCLYPFLSPAEAANNLGQRQKSAGALPSGPPPSPAVFQQHERMFSLLLVLART